MDIRKPEYIVAIAEEGSITERRAAVSQAPRPQPLSSRLEESIGTSLFVRTRSGLVPTAAARSASAVKQILSAMRQTQKELGDITGCTSGTMRIGITWQRRRDVHKIFRIFHSEYPGFEH
jgi:DNA-binding transcriptional LysR family regulator